MRRKFNLGLTFTVSEHQDSKDSKEKGNRRKTGKHLYVHVYCKTFRLDRQKSTPASTPGGLKIN